MSDVHLAELLPV